MKQSLRAILSFYFSFALFTGLISLGSWGIMETPLHQDFQRFLPLYILLKIITNSLIWYYLRSSNPGRLFFYANLGISEIRLFLTVFAMDIALFFVFIFILHLLF